MMRTIRGNCIIKSVYALQEPIEVIISRWYKHEAEDVVHVEHDKDGDIRVSIPTSSRTGVETGAIEQGLKDLVPVGMSALVDLKLRKVIYWVTTQKFVEDEWGFMPECQHSQISDFNVYLMTDYSEHFLECSGSSRNLHLGLFAQCRTMGLMGYSEQTEWGRSLAASLILAKFSLPSFTKLMKLITKDIRSTDSLDCLLLVECYDELTSIDTSPVKVVETQIPLLPAPLLPAIMTPAAPTIVTHKEVKEKHLEPYINLDFLLNLGLSGFENELTYPYDVPFEPDPSFGLHLITSIVLKSPTRIMIDMPEYTKEIGRTLEDLFKDDFDLEMKAPGYSVFLDRSSKEV